MNKLIVFLSVLFLAPAYSACSSVPESIRAEYASGMFEAFVTQSYGKSTIAFYRIYSSLNSLWALHQTELQALKNWEQTALGPAVNQ